MAWNQSVETLITTVKQTKLMLVSKQKELMRDLLFKQHGDNGHLLFGIFAFRFDDKLTLIYFNVFSWRIHLSVSSLLSINNNNILLGIFIAKSGLHRGPKFVGPLITQKSTRLWLPISAAERLALTFCYLATGDSQQSQLCHFQIGTSTLSAIIWETCDANWTQLCHAYLH